jgi:hypothetical protein
MSHDLDHQDLRRRIGFNSLMKQARESLASVPGTLARVIERSRSTSLIHDGAESLRRVRRPRSLALPQSSSAIGSSLHPILRASGGSVTGSRRTRSSIASTRLATEKRWSRTSTTHSS